MIRFHQARSVLNGNKGLPVWALLLACLGATPVRGQSPENSQSVPLAYTETSYQVLSVSLWTRSLQVVKAPFAKEPTLSKGIIHRATIKVFPNAADELKLIWDVTERRLHIDLNRNGDLTDDTNGVYVFPAIVSGGQSRFAEFKNIPVTFQSDGATHRGLFNLSLNSYGSQLSGNLNWRSSWQGKAVFGGREYQVGLVDPLGDHPAHFLVRNWDLRQSAFSVGSASAATVPIPKKIFIAGQAFELKRLDGASPTVVFAPISSTLGELALPGKNINRLVLTHTREGTVVVLDNPGAIVKVPVGEYSEPFVLLKSGKDEAYRERANYGRAGVTFTVSEAKPTVFAGGGPLSNTVTANVRGPTLAMNYKLVGADGAEYKLAAQDHQNPPRVSIRKNGKEIHSGKFAYG